MVLFGLTRGELPKYLIWCLGATYMLVMLHVIFVRSSLVGSVNLNSLTLINYIVCIPFYPVANFISFIPIGIFIKYLSANVKSRILSIGGFLGSIIIEAVQYIFRLGVTDINDVI